MDLNRARQYADDARNASPCIKINAILVTYQTRLENDARSVMQDYAATTCGWYAELPSNGEGIEEAVVEMLYTAGACTCP